MIFLTSIDIMHCLDMALLNINGKCFYFLFIYSIYVYLLKLATRAKLLLGHLINGS